MMNYHLQHHGIKGQKWGVRRYQNEDGSYTPEGKRRRNDHLTIQRNGVIQASGIALGMHVMSRIMGKKLGLNPAEIANGKKIATMALLNYGTRVIKDEIHYKRTGEVKKL